MLRALLLHGRVCLVLGLVAGCVSVTTDSVMERPTPNDLVIVAHRGSMQAAPENSLAGASLLTTLGGSRRQAETRPIPASAACIGVGAPGGLIGPSIVIGAMVGGLFAYGLLR